MKLSHLLAGVAAAAVLGGGAFAQNFTVAGSVGDANLGSTYRIASELNVSSANIVAPLSFTITPNGGSFGTGAGVAGRVTVNLTGFVFSAAVQPTALTGACGAGASIVSGGLAGDSTVTLQIADVQACDAGGVVFTSPVLFTGPSGNLSLNLVRAANGQAIQGGSFTNDSNGAVAGDQPFVVTSVRGVSIGGVGSAGVATGATANLPGYTTLSSSTVGGLSITVGGTGVAATTGVFKNFDTATVIAPADIAALTVSASVAAPAGLNLAGAQLGGQAATVSGSNLSFNVTGLAAGNQVRAFVLPASATTPAAITEQNILASANLSFTGVLLQPQAFNNVLLGRILRQGATSQTFEWVGDQNANTLSIFRHTGFVTGTGAPLSTLPTIRVQISNSALGAAAREFILDTSGLSVNAGGELVTNSSIIGQQAAAAFGSDFVRGNVRFFIESAANVQTRRYLIGTNGSITTFDADFVDNCSGTATNGAITPAGGDFAGAATAAQANSTLSLTCTR